MELGNVCQSCGMPMADPSQFGTEADSSLNEEYCTYCFQNGEFTDPDLTLNDQIEKLVKMAVEKMGASEDDAREMAERSLPKLKRWQ